MRYFLLCGSLLFIFLVGCQQEEQTDSLERTKHVQHVKDSDPRSVPEASNTEIAEHLSELASHVPDVNDATTVIAGPYAIVAIDVDRTLDSARVGTVKYTVSEALYKDLYGKTAIVISDPDVLERFKEMNEQIRAGHPIKGIVDELAAIVGRAMPIWPTDDQQAPDTDQMEEQVPDGEEEEIENIQEDHGDGDKYE